MTDSVSPTSPPKMNLSLYKDGPIQRFSDAGLQAQIDKAAALIPADKHVAVVAVANKDGVAAAAVARVGKDFTIMLAGEKGWKTPASVQAAIRWTPI